MHNVEKAEDNLYIMTDQSVGKKEEEK